MEILRPRQYVELGTYKGDSYCAFCQAVVEFGLDCKTHAVDTWEGDSHVGGYGDEVYDNLRQYHDSKYAAFSRLHRMRFEEAVECFADNTIDLLHIDGLHTYEAVKQDFETWKCKLSQRAIVLFHDSAVRERGFGVWKFLMELEGSYPIFHFNHSNGLACLVYGDEAPDILKDIAKMKEEDAKSVKTFFHVLGDRVQAYSQINFWRKESERLFQRLEVTEKKNKGS